MRPTAPLKQDVARRIRATAGRVQQTHPEMVAHQHLRSAATMISSGRVDGAKRHLDAAMEMMTPRNLVRHGITDDEGHAVAKQTMHQINVHRLQVMDIEDIHTANQAEAERRRSAAEAEREAKAKRAAIRTGVFPQPAAPAAEPGEQPGVTTGKGPNPVGRPAATSNGNGGSVGSSGGGSQPPVPKARTVPPRPVPAGAQLSNIELAYDPSQPRDIRGRWAHVPGSGVQSLVRAVDRGDTREQQRSGIWGSYGTFAFHQAQLSKLTKAQHRVYIREIIRGTPPGDALDTARAHGRPGTASYPRQNISGAQYSQTGPAIELSARTAMLERTPAPYGKPGGPGLYGKAGNKHSDYFEQVVQALMRKRGMDKATASKIAWGALRKWRRGGGHVHPEVMAAAGRALGQEAAAGATHTHAVSPWEMADRLIELAAGGPQWQAEGRVPAGQAGGGQFGGGKGEGQGKPGKAARRATLVRKASALRAEIRALEALLPHTAKAAAHHKPKSSTPAKKGAAATSAKQAKQGKTASGKAPAAKAAKPGMTPAAIHSKIIALRAELAGIMAQIHQLANDGEAVELSWATAWLHEARGKGGRWTTDGGVSARMIKPVKPPRRPNPAVASLRAKIGREKYKLGSRDVDPGALAAVERPLARLAGPHPLQVDPIDRHGRPLTMAARKLAAQQQDQPITQQQLQEAIYHAVSEMHTAEYKLRAEEDKRRRQKLAVHAGAIVGGAALTYAETKLPGVPEAVTAMTAPGLLVAQELVDWAKRL